MPITCCTKNETLSGNREEKTEELIEIGGFVNSKLPTESKSKTLTFLVGPEGWIMSNIHIIFINIIVVIHIDTCPIIS